VIKTSHIVASVLLLVAGLAIFSQLFTITYREKSHLPGESANDRISESSSNGKHSKSTGGAKTRQTRPAYAETGQAELSAGSNATLRSVLTSTATQSEVNDREIVAAENLARRPTLLDRGDTMSGDASAHVDEADLNVGSSIVADLVASGSSGDGGRAGGAELVISVPPGEKIPALFLDETPRPIPQQKMLDRMAAEFHEAVSSPVPGMSELGVWEQARLDADEKYLILFGYEAYNLYHLQAAQEAVRERRALQATQPSKK
jgi:hypothetical protein